MTTVAEEIELLNILDAEIKERCESSYSFFLRAAWDVIEPATDLQWGWHLDYLCRVLQEEVFRIGNREPKKYEGIIINVPPRSAKAVEISTLIPTPDGFKQIRDIHPGDTVYGLDGKQRRVVAESPVFYDHDCYEIEFSTGEKVIADAGHQWLTHARIINPGRGKRGPSKGSKFSGDRGTCGYKEKSHKARNATAVRTTEEISKGVKCSDRWNHSIDVACAVESNPAKLDIPPYTLGVWLGDGSSKNSRIHLNRGDSKTIIDGIESEGVRCRKLPYGEKENLLCYSIGPYLYDDNVTNSDTYTCKLRDLIGDIGKHIPEQYLMGSYGQRMALLKGLMDTDGTAPKNSRAQSYSTVRKRLAEDVKTLMASLGFKPTITSTQAKCNGKIIGTAYNVSITSYDDTPIFKPERKYKNQRPRTTRGFQGKRQIVAVNKIKSVPVKCISVDSPDHMFLVTKSYIPTHNSTLVTKALQPWAWIIDPSQKFLTASYGSDLSLEHAVESRRIVTSEWYQRNWGDRFSLTTDQNVKSYYENDKSGYRIATSVDGRSTGSGGDWIIGDDILSADEAESPVKIANANRWWTRTMFSRLNNQKIGIRILVMQRLHMNDPTGYVLDNFGKKYLHICLPAEESDNISPPELRKFYVKGLLQPERFDKAFLQESKENDAYAHAGQYNQNPTPPEGGKFKRQYWKFWQPKGSNLPEVHVKINDKNYTCPVVDLPQEFDHYITSWDATFDKTEDSDYVVGQAWGTKFADKYLLDQVRDRMDYTDTVEKIVNFQQKHLTASACLIENKANGPAIISALKRKVTGLIPSNPGAKSKEARANPASDQQKAGQLILPHPSLAPWVKTFIDNCADFPKTDVDDEIDSMSQAVNHLDGTKKIWKGYKGATIAFKIDFTKLEKGSDLYVTQWVAKNGATALLLCLWSKKNGTLCVFDEMISDSPQAENIIVGVTKKIRSASANKVMTHKNFGWFGNKLMFDGSANLSELYSKYKVFLMENEDYNEHGAIGHVGRLIARKKLMIHNRCKVLRQDAQNWCYESGSPAKGFESCRALSNLANVLYEAGRLDPNKAKPMKHYSKERTHYIKEMNKLSERGDWKGRAKAQKDGLAGSQRRNTSSGMV